MKKSRFTEQQIVAVLKEAEAAVKTADLCRKYGVSIRALNVVDDFTRESIAIEVDTSIAGGRVCSSPRSNRN